MNIHEAKNDLIRAVVAFYEEPRAGGDILGRHRDMEAAFACYEATFAADLTEVLAELSRRGKIPMAAPDSTRTLRARVLAHFPQHTVHPGIGRRSHLEAIPEAMEALKAYEERLWLAVSQPSEAAPDRSDDSAVDGIDTRKEP